MATDETKTAKDAAKLVDRAQLRAVFDTSAARAFFTQLAVHLDIKPCDGIPTADVDGKTIRYNPDFIASLSPDHVHGVMVGHEPGHCALSHLTRGSMMECGECRNLAADLEVNQLCREAGFSLPAGAVFAAEGHFKDCPVGDTFEQHYARLHAKHKKQGAGSGEQDGPSGPQAPGSTPPALDPGGCGTFSPAQDAAQAEQIEANWRAKIADAGQVVSRKMAEGKLKGDLPGDLKRWVDSILHPKVTWQSVLRDFTTQTLKANHENDWARPSRRGLGAGLYLPGRKGERLGELVVAIDTSGSIGDETLAAFSAELNSILACQPAQVDIVYCDAAINAVEHWEPDDGELVLRAVGGGGTSHVPVWEYIKEHEGEPACVVCLTDGYTEHGREPHIPVLWCITPDGSTDVPFGRVVTMEA